MILDDHESIGFCITGRNGITVFRPSGEPPRKNLPGPVLRAFDPSIESLSFGSELYRVHHLAFHGENERAMGLDTIPSFLSQGTIVGAEMVWFALERLKDGDYMIIDEIETSLLVCATPGTDKDDCLAMRSLKRDRPRSLAKTKNLQKVRQPFVRTCCHQGGDVFYGKASIFHDDENAS